MKILSLNLQLLPPPLTTTGNNFKDERLLYFIHNVLPNYDVVCLSEVWHAHKIVSAFKVFSKKFNRLKTLIEEAAKKGFKYFVHSPKLKFSSKCYQNGGLLILSKLPIEKTSYLIFKQPGCNIERFVQNGALFAKINNICIFSAHLQSDQVTRKRIRGAGTKVRAQQLSELKQFIKNNKSKYSILVGDLNIDALPEAISGHATDTKLNNQAEYLDMINTLHARDLLFYNEHPITLGDIYVNEFGKLIPCGKELTARDDLCSQQSVDHALLLFKKNAKYTVSSDNHITWYFHKTRLKIVTGIEKLKVSNKKFSQLSDHYGVSIEIFN